MSALRVEISQIIPNHTNLKSQIVTNHTNLKSQTLTKKLPLLAI
jgi:hypothetical protein